MKTSPSPMQVLQNLQELKTKEEMITYLKSLPRKDIPWPKDPQENEEGSK